MDWRWDQARLYCVGLEQARSDADPCGPLLESRPCPTLSDGVMPYRLSPLGFIEGPHLAPPTPRLAVHDDNQPAWMGMPGLYVGAFRAAARTAELATPAARIRSRGLDQVLDGMNRKPRDEALEF